MAVAVVVVVAVESALVTSLQGSITAVLFGSVVVQIQTWISVVLSQSLVLALPGSPRTRGIKRDLEQSGNGLRIAENGHFSTKGQLKGIFV